MREGSMSMEPVSLKEPKPFLFDLKRGKPAFPLCLPCMKSSQRRKKCLKATSRSLNASWGAHLETS